MTRPGAIAVSACLLGAAAVAALRGEPSPMPRVLESYLSRDAHLTAAETQALLAGDPIAKLLDSDPGTEVAVLGAVWIDALPSAYVHQVQDIENFERGDGFMVTKRISSPPAAQDFAGLQLPDDDLDDLRACRVGNCEIKLGADALNAFRAQVDWRAESAKADANRLFRQFLLDYVTGYREGGNARLAVYRDKRRPTFVATEFRSMIDRLPPLAAYFPDIKRYLIDYPRVTLPDASDFLYWQVTQFGLKPTIRVSHVVIQQRPERTVVASKMLYASHYFWTALEVRVLLPDPDRGGGFWFVTVSRSRSDGLSGFVGGLVRGRVRSEAQSGTLAVLRATRERLELRR